LLGVLIMPQTGPWEAQAQALAMALVWLGFHMIIMIIITIRSHINIVIFGPTVRTGGKIQPD